jgi:hypothetical protein
VRRFANVFRFVIPLLLPLALSLSAAEFRPERWRWSNPLPHGNNVMDMLATSTWAVQVGDSGSVFLQREDERWTPVHTGVTNYLRGVALMGDRLVVVGEDGCILWTTNGAVFNKAALSGINGQWFESVAATSQRAVAVGDEGFIYTTTNGLTWAKANSGTAQWLRGVAFGNGVFVAVGENGKIFKSSNAAGTSWSLVTSGTTAHLNRVRLVGSASAARFIAVGTGGTAISSSTGGAPWTSLNSGTTNTLFDVAVNDSGTLLVGDQEILFKPDGGSSWVSQITGVPADLAAPAWTYYTAFGVSNSWSVAGRTGLLLAGSPTADPGVYAWMPVPDSSHAWLWDVTVQQGICVAVGDLATIQTSLDGILWAREVVPGPRTNVVLLGVGGSTNLLLAAGNAGTVFYSLPGLTNMSVTKYVGTNIVVTNSTFNTLGLIWEALPAFTTNTLQGVAATESLYVVCGERGSVFTSPNGLNWTPRATPTTNLLSGIAAFPSGWIAAGARGTLLRAGPDAAAWSLVNLGTTNWIYRVRHTGGHLIAVGQNGSIYTSTDGNAWTSRVSGTKAWLNDVTWLDNKWFVVGTQGTILSSSDLASWTPVPSPTIKSLYAAAANGGALFCLGIEGVILRNQVQPITSPVRFLGYDLSYSVGMLSQVSYTNMYELFLFGGQPDQLFQFQSATDLVSGPWTTLAEFELFDSSGTIYLIRTRDKAIAPAGQFYRTRPLP